MFKTLKLTLADGSEKDFDFLATGTTQYRYKQLFRTDLMKDLTGIINSFNADGADFSTTDKLAFIMNCQAKKMDMNRINDDMFMEWLEQFDSSTLIDNFNEFVGIYIGNKESTSNPKKEDGQQTEK